MPSRHRIVVGIDYGTTFSGVSFVTTDKTSIDDIHVIRAWPGGDGHWKTPTRIAYAFENAAKGLRENAWGYQVEPTMTSCSWTKLLLDINTKDTAFDDPKLRAAVDEGMLRLPGDKDAQKVCEDFLRELHGHMIARLCKQMRPDVFESTPMDCWLTVPALWSDQAQSATKAAAQAAGFGSRSTDTISVISEPEAAAVAVLKKHLKPGALNPPKVGEDILVCDCGGGTVDITTYSIVETTPRLVFDELCVGIGGKCGATYIDRNLHKLMSQRFGKAFDDIEMRRKGPGSRFMESWERVKRSFGGPGDYRTQEVGPLVMHGVGTSQYYDEDDSVVRLTYEDVESCFAPVVNEVIKLVSKQVNDVKKRNRFIDRLILIGGFGDSDYLCSRLKLWCATDSSIQIECPEHPQAAIVRGAALRGLEGTAPRTKRCRRHYGISYGLPFRQGYDPEDKAYVDKWTGTRMCRGRMHWLIAKGDKITKETHKNVDLVIACTKNEEMVSSVSLFSCSLDEPPEFDDHPRVDRVGTIRADFTKVDKSKFESKRQHDWYGHRMWHFAYTAVVAFGERAGLLAFRTLIKGAISGTASITFD